MIDYLLVRSEDGDWEGLYINGHLEYEGHSIDYGRFIQDHLYGSSLRIDMEAKEWSHLPLFSSDLWKALEDA